MTTPFLTFDQALAEHRANRLDVAKRAYEHLASQFPDDPEIIHLLGVVAFQRGLLADALPLVERCLSMAPNHAKAWNTLANIRVAKAQPKEAITALKLAVQHDPSLIPARRNLGVLLNRTGNPALAIPHLRHALAAMPENSEGQADLNAALQALPRLTEADFLLALAEDENNADAAHFLGVLYFQKDRGDEGIALLRRAAAIRSEDVKILVNLGWALRAKGALADAAETTRRAVDLTPDHWAASNNLGAILLEMGRMEEAVQIFTQAAKHWPNDPRIHNNLGLGLKELGQLELAINTFRQAAALAPSYAETHYNLGLALSETGCHADAIRSYIEAIRLNPNDARPRLSLGLTYKAQGELVKAEMQFREGIRLQPREPAGYRNLAGILKDRGDKDGAINALKEAMAHIPESSSILPGLGELLKGAGRLDEVFHTCHQAVKQQNADALTYYCYGNILCELGRLDEGLDALRRAIQLDPIFEDAHTHLLSFGLSDDTYDQNDAITRWREFATSSVQANRVPLLPAPRSWKSDERLKIGYLSSDLHQHPVAGNLLPVVENHDKSRFSIHYYSTSTRSDVDTVRFRAVADGWTDMAHMNDPDIADRIRADGIDILVCCAGRFDRNRLLICNYRPAPIQISYWDAASSYSDSMDYLFTDRTLTPRHTSEFFSERLLRLPSLHIAYFPDRAPATFRASGPVTFGCFNNPVKISPKTLLLWGRILASLPESRLRLRYLSYYSSAQLKKRILDALTASGARPEQVIFSSEYLPFSEHMAQYNEIDIALDTMPFSGSTTSFQALVMGVPIVTWPQDRMVSSWTHSMLRVLRLSHLVACDADQYVDMAIACAADVATWRARRTEIRNQLKNSPLCDGVGRARQVEHLYRAVWNRHVKSAK